MTSLRLGRAPTRPASAGRRPRNLTQPRQLVPPRARARPDALSVDLDTARDSPRIGVDDDEAVGPPSLPTSPSAPPAAEATVSPSPSVQPPRRRRYPSSFVRARVLPPCASLREAVDCLEAAVVSLPAAVRAEAAAADAAAGRPRDPSSARVPARGTARFEVPLPAGLAGSGGALGWLRSQPWTGAVAPARGEPRVFLAGRPGVPAGGAGSRAAERAAATTTAAAGVGCAWRWTGPPLAEADSSAHPSAHPPPPPPALSLALPAVLGSVQRRLCPSAPLLRVYGGARFGLHRWTAAGGAREVPS